MPAYNHDYTVAALAYAFAFCIACRSDERRGLAGKNGEIAQLAEIIQCAARVARRSPICVATVSASLCACEISVWCGRCVYIFICLYYFSQPLIESAQVCTNMLALYIHAYILRVRCSNLRYSTINRKHAQLPVIKTTSLAPAMFYVDVAAAAAGNRKTATQCNSFTCCRHLQIMILTKNTHSGSKIKQFK